MEYNQRNFYASISYQAFSFACNAIINLVTEICDNDKIVTAIKEFCHEMIRHCARVYVEASNSEIEMSEETIKKTVDNLINHGDISIHKSGEKFSTRIDTCLYDDESYLMISDYIVPDVIQKFEKIAEMAAKHSLDLLRLEYDLENHQVLSAKTTKEKNNEDKKTIAEVINAHNIMFDIDLQKCFFFIKNDGKKPKYSVCFNCCPLTTL